MRVHVWAAWRQPNWLDTFIVQEGSKRLAELGVTIHDQMFLPVEDTIFMVRELAGRLFQSTVVGARLTACDLDATGLELHNKEQIVREGGVADWVASFGEFALNPVAAPCWILLEPLIRLTSDTG